MSVDPALIGRLAGKVRDLETSGAPPGVHTHPWAEVTGKPSTYPPATHGHAWGEISGAPATYPPDAHGHAIGEVTALQAGLDAKAAASHGHAWGEITGKPATFPPDAHSHAISGVTGLQAALDGKSDVGHTHAAGSGAKAVYLPLLQHVTTLENTTSANATWKIPAATTYGQVAVYLNMPTLGTPASAQLVGVYTNTATTGTNQLGLRLGAAPVAAGTTITPVASSVVTLANSATFPQTFVKAVTPSELGTAAVWGQWGLLLATSTVGPNMMSLALILYY